MSEASNRIRIIVPTTEAEVAVLGRLGSVSQEPSDLAMRAAVCVNCSSVCVCRCSCACNCLSRSSDAVLRI